MAEKNSLWKNIRANRGSGKKIKAEYAKRGPVGDDELYNMQRALDTGLTADETGHWPSVDSETGMWLKSKEHPTAWMEYLYGHTLNPELNRTTNVVVNPEGYFGNNQLQYIPKEQKATGGYYPTQGPGKGLFKGYAVGGEDDIKLGLEPEEETSILEKRSGVPMEGYTPPTYPLGKKRGLPELDNKYQIDKVQEVYGMYNEKAPFLKNWFSDPSTGDRLKSNLQSGKNTRNIDPKELTDHAIEMLNNTPIFSREIARNKGVSLKDIQYSNQLQGWGTAEQFGANPYFTGHDWFGGKNLGQMNRDTGQIMVDTLNDHGTVAHEGTHVDGEFQNTMESVINQMYGNKKDTAAGYDKYLKSMGFSKGMMKDKESMKNLKQNWNNTEQYLNRDGMYPRIMDIRSTLKLQSGQPVDKSILNNSSITHPLEDLRHYYDDDTIVKMLNELASNNQQSPLDNFSPQNYIQKAATGGYINPYNQYATGSFVTEEGEDGKPIIGNENSVWLPYPTGEYGPIVGTNGKVTDRGVEYPLGSQEFNGGIPYVQIGPGAEVFADKPAYLQVYDDEYERSMAANSKLQESWYRGQDYNKKPLEERATARATDKAARYILQQRKDYNKTENDFANRQEYLKSFNDKERSLIQNSNFSRNLEPDAGTQFRMAASKIIQDHNPFKRFSKGKDSNLFNDADVTQEDYDNASRWGLLSPFMVGVETAKSIAKGDISDIKSALTGKATTPWVAADKMVMGQEGMAPAVNVAGDMIFDPFNLPGVGVAEGLFGKLGDVSGDINKAVKSTVKKLDPIIEREYDLQKLSDDFVAINNEQKPKNYPHLSANENLDIQFALMEKKAPESNLFNNPVLFKKPADAKFSSSSAFNDFAGVSSPYTSKPKKLYSTADPSSSSISYQTTKLKEFKKGLKKGLKEKLEKAQDFLNKPLFEKPTNFYSEPLATNSDYESWANRIFREDEIGLITLDELKEAHKKSIEHFKKIKAPVVTGKEHGLYIKSLFVDRLPNYNSTLYDDAGNRIIIKTNGKERPAEANFPEMEEFIKTHGYDITKMTPEQRLLMESYAHGYDNSMNSVLRGERDVADKSGLLSAKQGPVTKWYIEKAKKLNEGILQNKFKEATEVRRGIQSDYPVELLDPITHQPTGVIKNRSQLTKGDVFVDKSMMSTSMKNVGWGNAHLSEVIEIPGGSVQSFALPEAANFTQFRSESEAILPSDLIREVLDDDFYKHPNFNKWEAKFRTKILNPHAQGGYVNKYATGGNTMKNNNQSWRNYLQYTRGGIYDESLDNDTFIDDDKKYIGKKALQDPLNVGKAVFKPAMDEVINWITDPEFADRLTENFPASTEVTKLDRLLTTGTDKQIREARTEDLLNSHRKYIPEIVKNLQEAEFLYNPDPDINDDLFNRYSKGYNKRELAGVQETLADNPQGFTDYDNVSVVRNRANEENQAGAASVAKHEKIGHVEGAYVGPVDPSTGKRGFQTFDNAYADKFANPESSTWYTSKKTGKIVRPDKTEFYPFLMQLRLDNKMQPGEIIDDAKLDAIRKSGSSNPLLRHYKNDKLLKYLNTFASNKTQEQPQQQMQPQETYMQRAARGGYYAKGGPFKNTGYDEDLFPETQKQAEDRMFKEMEGRVSPWDGDKNVGFDHDMHGADEWILKLQAAGAWNGQDTMMRLKALVPPPDYLTPKRKDNMLEQYYPPYKVEPEPGDPRDPRYVIDYENLNIPRPSYEELVQSKTVRKPPEAEYAQGGYTNPYNQYQDDPYLQYANGGQMYGKGGFKTALSGLYGAGEGFVDSTFGWIPGVDQATDFVYKGLQKAGNSTDDEKRKQDAARGFGEVAGSAGSAIFTGGATLGSAIGNASQGLGEGIAKSNASNANAQAVGAGIGMLGGFAGALVGNASSTKDATKAFKASTAGSTGLGKFAAAAPMSSQAFQAAQTAKAASNLDSLGNVIGSVAPEGTKIATDAVTGLSSSINPNSIGVLAQPLAATPNVSSLAPNLSTAASAASLPNTSDYSNLSKIADVTNAISSVPKSQQPPPMAPPVAPAPLPDALPQTNYEQFAVNAPPINTGLSEINYSFGNEAPSNNFYMSHGGSMSNNSLNLRDTMRYKKFANGGPFNQNGITILPKSGALHHESANGGIPFNGNALAEGGEIIMNKKNGSKFVVSDTVDGTNSQPDFMFTKDGKYKQLNRSLADGMNQKLKKYTMGGLATNPKDKDKERRPGDSKAAFHIEQISNEFEQKNEYAMQRNDHDKAIAQAIEQKRMAEEQFIGAYGGKVSRKNYPNLNRAKGGYVHNQMTQPMLAEGGPLYENTNPEYAFAMGGVYGEPYAFGGEDKPWNAPMPIGPFGNTQPQPTQLSPGMQQLQNRFDADKIARNGAPIHPRIGQENVRKGIENVFAGRPINPDGSVKLHTPYNNNGPQAVNPAFNAQLQNTNALTRARGGRINYTNDMYAGGGPMPSNVPQAFNGPSAQNRGGMYLYPDGGMMPPEQQMMQEQMMQQQQAPQEQMQQQGGGQEQMMQMVQQAAQMLQQGAQPEQVMQQLVQSGVPQDMAMQAIQMAMQELQGQMQQQEQGQQMMAPQEQMAPQQPMMARGGYFNGKKQYFTGSVVGGPTKNKPYIDEYGNLIHDGMGSMPGESTIPPPAEPFKESYWDDETELPTVGTAKTPNGLGMNFKSGPQMGNQITELSRLAANNNASSMVRPGDTPWYEESKWAKPLRAAQAIPGIYAMVVAERNKKRKLTPNLVSPSKIDLSAERMTDRDNTYNLNADAQNRLRGSAANAGMLAANVGNIAGTSQKALAGRNAESYGRETNTNAQFAQQANMTNTASKNAYDQLNFANFQAQQTASVAGLGDAIGKTASASMENRKQNLQEWIAKNRLNTRSYKTNINGKDVFVNEDGKMYDALTGELLGG